MRPDPTDLNSFGPGLEHMKKMSDWDLPELEEFDWDDFCYSDHQIVPHRGVELVNESLALSDAHKKPRHEVKIDAGHNMCSRGFATKTVLWDKEDTCFPLMKDGSSSILERLWSPASNILVPALSDPEPYVNVVDAKISGSSVSDSNTDTIRNMFCSKDSSLGTMVSTNDCKCCLSPLNGVYPDVTDVSYLESEQNDTEIDLAYNDWPDISNFKDNDKMFRNWDPTFGQGQTVTANELSWFSSSSHTICGPGIAFETDLQSSSSELGVLHAKLEHDCANTNFQPNNVQTSTSHDKPSSSNYADWLATDSQNKARSASKEKLCEGDNARNIGPTRISNEHSLNESTSSNIMIESQHSSERKGMKRSADQVLLDSVVSASQMNSSLQFSQKKHFIGSSSSYMHNLNPHAHLEFSLATHQVPFAQTTSNIEFENKNKPSSSYKVSDHVLNHPIQCMERLPDQLYMPQIMAKEVNIENLHQRQQLCATVTAKHPQQQPAFQRKTSGQKKQLQTRSDTKSEDISLQLPTVEIYYPPAQKSSGMTSVFSDDISEKATSFQQLQDVMHQLDVRTKLCIRDSLYHLAKSSKQRHSFSMHNCGGNTDSEASKNRSAHDGGLIWIYRLLFKRQPWVSYPESSMVPWTGSLAIGT